MRTTLVALTLLAAACSAVGAGSDSLRAGVSPRPATLRTNVWTPTVTLTRNGRPASAPLVLRIRKGTTARAFRARAMRRGAYRVRVTFPAEGRWTWAIASGRQTLTRGAVTVSRSVRFQLPYDLTVAPDGSIYFVDHGRVLLFDPQTQRARVYATTQSDELVAIVRAADGTLYVADITGNQILRVDTRSRVAVVAPVTVPGDMTIDATGTTLWAGSIEGGVFRIDIASGRVDRIDDAIGVHGIDRDSAGNLYVHDSNRISRIDARTGRKTLFADVDAGKILVVPDGSLYAGVGGPAGGQIVRIFPNGTVTPVVGTGAIGSHADGLALEAQILPGAAQFARDGALLVTQTQPIPAIRRVDLATGRITTIVRGD
jgi:sugar lactone lactonase YvrE